MYLRLGHIGSRKIEYRLTRQTGRLLMQAALLHMKLDGKEKKLCCPQHPNISRRDSLSPHHSHLERMPQPPVPCFMSSVIMGHRSRTDRECGKIYYPMAAVLGMWMVGPFSLCFLPGPLQNQP